jgi:large subunit ribosomal protein L17
MKEDQAESAILELVDGPKDMRFAMTAKTLAQIPTHKQFNEKTAENIKKVTRFREDGVEQLRDMVTRMRLEKERGIDDRILPPPRKVYPETKVKRELHYYEDVDPYTLANPLTNRKTKVSSEKEELDVVAVDESQSENTQARPQIS